MWENEDPVDDVEAGRAWAGWTVLALAAGLVLVIFSGGSFAATYGIGSACGDPAASFGISALLREFRSQYPRPSPTGTGLIGLNSVGISVTGLATYQEALPNGTVANYTLQLPTCSTDRCVPNGITVAPCPYGYAPYSAGLLGASPSAVSPSTEHDVALWDQQTMLLVAGLMIMGVIGFRTGFRP